MKYIFNVMLLFFFHVVFSQTDSLEVDSLESSCRRYYELKAQAEIEEFKQVRKYKFLRFLPTIGYAIARQSLVVGVNSSSAIKYLEDKQIRRNKVSSIVQSNNLALERDLLQLHLLKQEIRQVQEKYQTALATIEIERKIFRIKKQQYNQAELEPLLFLQSQKTLLQQEQKVKDIQYNIFQLNQQLLIIAKWTI